MTDQANTPAQASGAGESLYAFADCKSMILPNGARLLVSQHSDAQMTVSSDVETALGYCRSFRSVRGHARHLVTTMPELGGNEEDVARVIEAIVGTGLMVTAEEACAALVGGDGQQELAQTRVCIITCDRPDAVERLLESVLRGAALGGHEHLYLVDDSRRAENAARNEALVASFNLTSPREMSYVGARAQQLLLEQLVQDLPESETGLRFLLDRDQWVDQPSYGLARTVCLLLSVGYRALVLDDDVLCAAFEPAEMGKGVGFGSGDGIHAAFYGSTEQCLSELTPAPLDPLLGHASCLGLELRRALAKLGEGQLKPADLAGVDLGDLRDLHGDSPVLLTQCGRYGDPGTAGNEWLADISDESLNRLLQNQQGLPAALHNRHYWLGHGAPRVLKQGAMSQVTGLDNTRALPPYFPAFRGEDLLFAGMLDCLFPDSVALEYNWAVPHVPLTPRTGNTDGDSTVARSPVQVCHQYLSEQRFETTGQSYEQRLACLTAALERAAQSDDEALQRYFRTGLARIRAQRVQRLNTRVQETGARDPKWQAYLQHCLNENVQALQGPARMLDMPSLGGEESEGALLEQFRSWVGAFADALRAWPAIREAAAGRTQALRDTGEFRAA